MKKFKLLTAGLLATAVASMASAQTFVKLTGSTAYRKATYDAIVHSLTGPKGAFIGGAADLSGATQAVITGTISGNAVVIQTAFGGSVGGVHVLTGSLTTIPGASFDSAHTWLSSTGGNTLTALSVNADGTIAGATNLAAPAYDAVSTAQAANSDTYQATTPFATPVLLQENPTGKGVGVVQFYAVKGRQESPDIPNGSSTPGALSGYNGFTNITAQQWGLLISAGIVPLSEFTGNSADAIYDVVAEGRNNDSGTREITEAETSLGFFPNQSENLFEAVITAGSITGLNNVGDVGYASGGSVATDLKTPITSGTLDANGNPFILLGYVGKSDKNTAVTGGAVAINYCGSDSSDASIENGLYSYWGYEHTYYKSGLSAIQQSTLNAISLQLRTTDAVNSGILLSNMNVSRLGDGSAPQ